MFIKELIIEKGDGEIRNIQFHKGLNLIVDETPSNDEKKSGNNLGKTTLLKLIDYCLGSKGQNIYQEKESKDNQNNKNLVKSFLINHEVIITLVLVNDLLNDNNHTIIIKRNFLKGKEQIYTINGNDVLIKTNDETKDAYKILSKLLFNHNSKKPSFRQIISKNIRYEDERLVNIVNILHNTTKPNVYEALYFFWFGISTDSAEEKEMLIADKNKEVAYQKHLEETIGSETIVKQRLELNKDEISKKEILRINLNVNENYKEDLINLDRIKNNIGMLKTKITTLSTRKYLILESKDELEKSKSNIDYETIKYIYLESKKLLPDLQKSFEETINFHNTMLKNKIEFITKELPSLKGEIKILENELDTLLGEESKFAKIVQKSSTFDELDILVIELNRLHETKGILETKITEWKESRENLFRVENRLREIESKNNSYTDIIEKNIRDFNKYFSELSKKLYNETLLIALSPKKNTKDNTINYYIDIQNFDGSPLGKGKKLGQIAVFDLAYIQFADSHSIKCLHFILHDDFEKVHDNQINTICSIVNDMNCQYIVAVLKDKLPNNIEVDKYGILPLSEDEKLFMIENT